ncbi:NrfD/PsrC family molybdoenzyme membrane anchor subunit [Spirosoma horti]
MSTITSTVRKPLVTGGGTYADVTEDVSRQVERPPTREWKIAITVAGVVLLYGTSCVFYTWWEGLGVWGLNKTIGWAWDITNFVWWVGIGHAGTLISAILLLFRQKWRTAVNRAAEAMTIFAVICAAMFIMLHLGRPWLAYWVFPLPDTFGSLWVNFKSPLVWDVFAISTYFTVSLVFWYMGLIPDLATIRDRTTHPVSRYLYGALALDWNGSAKTWARYEYMSLILAGLSTPLVLSVHTIVSMDFATSVIPGWHTTIFPPYFVAGAIFSGFAMVQNLVLIIRVVFKLENYITLEHIDSMNQVIILTGSIVGVAYITEFFIAWYSGNEFETYTFINRATGPYGWAYWAMMTCNVITPQLFWSKTIRRSIAWTFVLCVIVNIGMWFERFVIIATSLHRDFLPSSWAMFHPTLFDISDFIFSFGLFFTLFLGFAKFLPVINMAEVKAIIKSSSEQLPKPVTGNSKSENLLNSSINLKSNL